ncbi:hypothetical protein LIA77_00955 [Sarocladium implicatum]|nr:hypothetical protein LIA77_00955 [Sarocladium implicatum]
MINQDSPQCWDTTPVSTRSDLTRGGKTWTLKESIGRRNWRQIGRLGGISKRLHPCHAPSCASAGSTCGIAIAESQNPRHKEDPPGQTRQCSASPPPPLPPSGCNCAGLVTGFTRARECWHSTRQEQYSHHGFTECQEDQEMHSRACDRILPHLCGQAVPRTRPSAITALQSVPRTMVMRNCRSTSWHLG